VIRDLTAIAERQGASADLGAELLGPVEQLFLHWHPWQDAARSGLGRATGMGPATGIGPAAAVAFKPPVAPSVAAACSHGSPPTQ